MGRRHLEGSCKDWVQSSARREGVQRLRAGFAGAAYARHRHDTYAIGLTDSGAQCFWYRGGAHASLPGDALVLHPDEVHDGYAGTDRGFTYRIAYIEPARIAEACRAVTGRTCALPFISNPVVRNPRLRAAAEDLLGEEPGSDPDLLALAEALLEASGGPAPAPLRLDPKAVERARELLDAACPRVVHSSELEKASGLTRFELARQFRACLGTSPHRYAAMRRLERARVRIGSAPAVDVALDAGFADQPHFSRAFKAAYGLTPGRYSRLTRQE